jgi:hypothetical protein
VAETREAELPHPPLTPHPRNQIRWGYPPPPLLFCRRMGNAPGSLPLLLRSHFWVVGAVHLMLHRILGHPQNPSQGRERDEKMKSHKLLEQIQID